MSQSKRTAKVSCGCAESERGKKVRTVTYLLFALTEVKCEATEDGCNQAPYPQTKKEVGCLPNLTVSIASVQSAFEFNSGLSPIAGKTWK